MKRLNVFMTALAVLLAACAPVIPASDAPTPVVITPVVSTAVASTVGPAPTSGPLTPIPTLPSATLSPSELKYKVLERFPNFFFCDPDLYPVAREDETVLAQGRFAALQANQEEFQAILSHNGLSGTTTFTDEQKLLIYREHKKLNAIHFELAGDTYQFQIQIGTEGQQGSLITGTIDGNGSIEIQKQDPGFPSCPICLAAGTLIDTPLGAVAVENLQMGDQVWTVNEAGARIVGKILKLGNVRVPSTHQVVHMILSDGRELWASPGHPTAEDRSLGALKTGELLDGARVVLIERLPYKGTVTYDLLPAGDTGFYWANGILMASTLTRP